jgi:hydroxymethylpyrimidine pyrophosphatase-like HAD family hydrolase
VRGRNGSGRVKRGAVVNGAVRSGGDAGDAGGAAAGAGAGAKGGRDANGRPALVVCDLDGTLLDYHSTPVPGVLRAVAALRAAAVPVVICTGRAVAPTRALAVQLGLEHSVAIAYHGAVVVDVAGGRWLQRLDLPRQAVGPAVAALHEAGATLTAYVDDERWVQAEADGTGGRTAGAPPKVPPSPPTVLRPHRDLAAALDGVAVTRLIVAALDGVAVTRLIVAAPDGRGASDGAVATGAVATGAAATGAADAATAAPLARVLDELTARWPDLAVSPAAPGYLEVHHARADKHTALAGLCARLGVPAGAVVACGDGAPDAGMLSWAGMGVAIAEGNEQAAAAADVVVARDDLADLLTSLAGASEGPDRRR